MNLEHVMTPYSRAVVRLLKGPVDSTSRLWNNVLHYQTEIQKYVGLIGLELIVKKDEGFAYVKQLEDSEGNTLGLIPRKPLGFEVSIILILLRQMLEEFDSDLNELYATERYVTAEELKERVELFLPERFNRVKLLSEIESHIGKIVELGYLKEVKRETGGSVYQIHRIIKEKVTLDKLLDFKNKLQEYVESV